MDLLRTLRHWIGKPAAEPRGFVLALGGGGGRGLAHLGVLAALEEHGLQPAAIVGTSIGAMFGAMYALEPSIDQVRTRVLEMLESDTFASLELPVLEESDSVDQSWLSRLTSAARQSVLYTRAATGIALTDSTGLMRIADGLLGGGGFADAQIPIHVTAVAFPSGDLQLFSHGDLLRAVTASMAIPGVFEPIEVDGLRYVDGGLASELPTREARMVAQARQAVLAVNVGARPRPDVEPTNVIAMLDWAINIKSLYLRQFKAQLADVLIEPVHGYRQWADFSQPLQEIDRGYQAMLEMLPALLDRLGYT